MVVAVRADHDGTLLDDVLLHKLTAVVCQNLIAAARGPPVESVASSVLRFEVHQKHADR